jgi:hypothetical protein
MAGPQAYERVGTVSFVGIELPVGELVLAFMSAVAVLAYAVRDYRKPPEISIWQRDSRTARRPLGRGRPHSQALELRAAAQKRGGTLPDDTGISLPKPIGPAGLPIGNRQKKGCGHKQSIGFHFPACYGLKAVPFGSPLVFRHQTASDWPTYAATFGQCSAAIVLTALVTNMARIGV